MSSKAIFAVAGMAIAVSVTYFPAPPARLPRGADWTLHGLDYVNLHARRLRYAQEALFGRDPHLPGWYTRELGGTPFRSNVHNFPLIPTRLPLLLMDPDLAFSAGVQMAAFLTALFTYLYCRRLGLGHVASAVGGWTFACSGFFAARVLAGHLPLLEAYPALPLLLWLVEVNAQSPAGDQRRPWKLVAVAGASCAIALAGHPQVPAYSFVAAGLYALWRGHVRRGMMLAAAMVLGIGAAGFALYPMLLLVQRSTRILALAAPNNDVALPYSRLPAFVLPWRDGWPVVVDKMPPHAFSGYPNVAYFWDTVGYVGLLSVAAAAALAVRAIVRRERPRGPWLFIAALGIAALVLAFPTWHAVMLRIPGTLLRARPARST